MNLPTAYYPIFVIPRPPIGVEGMLDRGIKKVCRLDYPVKPDTDIQDDLQNQ